MLSRIRRLPGLRRLSNFQAGGYAAAAVVLVLSIVVDLLEADVFRKPPDELLVGLAGLGGAVFIAYTVGITGLLQDMRRGTETEVYIGSLVGLGFSGIAGAGMALCLLEASEPLGWLAHLAIWWACVSLFLLASLVAALPLFTYERAGAKHRNHDDE
jgi:hypothetical protein